MFFEGDRIDAMREMILAETRRGAEGGAGQAAAVPARGLRRHLPGAEGLPGDDPLPRSAAARVPAAHQGAAGGAGEEDRRAGRAHSPARRGAARVQPDARLPRLPPRHRLSRDLRDAGARGLRGRGRGAEGRHQGQARDHDPAGRLQEGARPAVEIVHQRRARCRPSRRSS